MAAKSMHIAGLAFIFVFLSKINAELVQGSVQLNNGVFDKIIKKYKAVLVKFDETYPYGDKQDAYKTVASATLSNPDLLVAEVHVADYGEKENSELAERYNAKKDEFPTYLLFENGNMEEPVRYKGDVKSAESIKVFLMKESGLWLGLPACLEEFDKLASEFLASKDRQDEIVSKAEAAKEKLTAESEKSSADIYIKTMQKIIEKGNSFIESEITRVEKLKSGKVSDKKKEQLGNRINILTSFQMRLKNNKKDEL